MEGLTPQTELEAVNQMLAAIGESPINTLEDSGLVDAEKAQQALKAMSRRVQKKGWSWNTDKAFTLALTSPDNFLQLPTNALKVVPAGNDRWRKVVQRGNRLYDTENSTYVFSAPIKVNLVSFLPFEELPETARTFITLAAARKFQENEVGSDSLSNFHKRDELQAWADLFDDEAEEADYNILRDDSQVAGTVFR